MMVPHTLRARLLPVTLATFVLAGMQAGCQSPAKRSDGRVGLFGKAQPQRLARNGSGGKGGGAQGGSFLLRVAEGRNLEKIGQWDEAREVYKRLRDEYPDRPEPYHRLAVVADRQRRHDEAQQLYTRALQLSPTDAELFNDLGYCFYLQGKLSKAESALRKAARLEPDNSRFHNNLGMVLGQLDRYDEALEQFAATGSDADAYYNLAFVYASQDKHDEAKSCFRQALSLDPTHDQAREALASFEQYDERGPLSEERELLAGEPSRDGVAYVPYIEGGAEDGSVADVSAESAVSAADAAASVSDAPTASATTSSSDSEPSPMVSRQTSRVPKTRLPGLLR